MEKSSSKFGFISWLHLIIIILFWTSPFWLNWELIILFIILFYLQILIFKKCILTIKQFKERSDETIFHYFFLQKIGFTANKKRLKIVVNFVIPGLVLLTALLRQVVFS